LSQLTNSTPYPITAVTNFALTFDDATSRRQRIATSAVGGRTSRDGSVRSASCGAKAGALIDR
jgi:hypothetical protein